MIKHCSALTILAGVGACLAVSFAPLAGADDPKCEPGPPDQQQQEQCQQNPGAGIANQVIDEVTDGIDSAQQAQQNNPKPNAGQPGLRVLVNGVDTCLPVGVPAPLGADVRIVPGDMTGHCTVGS